MYRKINYLFLLAVILSGLFSACMKQENYPDTPQIEYLNYSNVFDTGRYAVRGILDISFRDGNGDIGLSAGDTFPPYQKNGQYYYNYVIMYFEKQNGVYKQLELDPPFSSRIPVLTPLDPGKAIKGMIADTLVLNPHPLYDTIQIKAYIYDRGLHKSNEISTPEIILRRR
jgi:hypothetical protein